jgi:hypothetical protein
MTTDATAGSVTALRKAISEQVLALVRTRAADRGFILWWYVRRLGSIQKVDDRHARRLDPTDDPPGVDELRAISPARQLGAPRSIQSSRPAEFRAQHVLPLSSA